MDIDYTIQEINMVYGLMRTFEFHELHRFACNHEPYFDCIEKKDLFLNKKDFLLKPCKKAIREVWGAYVENGLVAMMDIREDPCDETVVNLGTLYVLPPCRGRGIADGLYEKGEAWAIERKYPAIHAHLHAKNKASIAFWEKHGFYHCAEFTEPVTWLDQSRSRVQIYRKDIVQLDL